MLLNIFSKKHLFVYLNINLFHIVVCKYEPVCIIDGVRYPKHYYYHKPPGGDPCNICLCMPQLDGHKCYQFNCEKAACGNPEGIQYRCCQHQGCKSVHFII